MQFSPKIIESLETRPRLWRSAQLVRYRNSRLIGQLVSPDHHIVLEGFPRSGNSFAIRSFLFANGARRTWSIAHHFHRLPQVSLAVQWNLPTVVFLRHPKDAVLSLIAHGIHLGRFQIEDTERCHHALRAAFDRWRFYHTHVLALRDHVVLSDFSATTGAFDTVMGAVNTRFDRDFHGVDTSAGQAKADIFKTGGTHLSPSPHRDTIKSHLADRIQHSDFDGPRESTERLYDRLLPHCVARV